MDRISENVLSVQQKKIGEMCADKGQEETYFQCMLRHYTESYSKNDDLRKKYESSPFHTWNRVDPVYKFIFLTQVLAQVKALEENYWYPHNSEMLIEAARITKDGYDGAQLMINECFVSELTHTTVSEVKSTLTSVYNKIKRMLSQCTEKQLPDIDA